MNWKFTRATSTRFEQDEPIAMLVPHQRGDLESYTVYTVSLSADPGRDAAFRRWSADRLLPTSQLKTRDRDRGREHHTEGISLLARAERMQPERQLEMESRFRLAPVPAEKMVDPVEALIEGVHMDVQI
jgi:antitoxin (DNA-binding transcriptional repressor) of toxin-antitoxin stability system